MKRLIYVYKHDALVQPYINEAVDVANLEVEINEPLETLWKNGARLVSAVPQEEKELAGHLEYLRGLRDKACWNWDARAHLTSVIEYLESRSKSDSRPVSKTDLPTPSEPSPPVQVAPRTLLEVRSHYWQTDIGHLGKAVGQLLISGYVDYGRCQRLMQHLAGLAEVCGKLHQELQCIPVDTLRRSDGAVASQK